MELSAVEERNINAETNIWSLVLLRKLNAETNIWS